MKFIEYLNAKKKMVEKPSTEIVPDYHGPLSLKPEKKKEEKKVGQPTPYKAPGSDEGQRTADNDKSKGFGNFASPGMQDVADKIKKYGYKESSTSLEQIINESKKNSHKPDNDVYITDPISGRKVTPMPHEAMRYATHLMLSNTSMPGRLVREAKKHGALKGLVSEMMSHPEVYSEMVDLMGHKEEGPKYAKKMVRAMNENYSNYLSEMQAMHNSFAQRQLGESVDVPRHKTMGFDADDDQSGADLRGQDDMDPNSLNDQPDTGDQPGSMPSSDDMGNGPSPDGSDDNPGSGFDTGAPAPSDDDNGLDMPKSMNRFSQEAQPSTESRLFAHHNMVNEMGKYGYMVDTMKQTCEKCGHKHQTL